MYISHGPLTPVKHLAVNLGAPGDKKDENGTIWFGYPRPNNTAGLQLDLSEEIIDGMGYYSYDSKGIDIKGAENSWLLTNGCVGFLNCNIPLIDDLFGEEAGTYTVRLGFVAPAGRREFDIKIQDDIVLENLDVLKEAGGVNQALIKEFNGIPVENTLSLEFIPESANPEISQAPVINFIEIIREDIPAGPESFERAAILSLNEAVKLLSEGEKDQDSENYSEALKKYHTVLEGSVSKKLRINAFKGMEAIASVKSLPVVQKYCQKLNPVMWDYKEPDQELLDAAVRVYIAIAGNYAKEDKEKALEMLYHSVTLTKDMTIRNLAIELLKDLGETSFSTVDPTMNGIAYKYYEGNWMVMPDFESLTPVQTGWVYEFGLEEIDHRGDGFGIRHTSYINIQEDGKYTFYVSSDDGSNLYIGEELVVNNDGTHSAKEASGSISLKAGRHPLIVDYFESGGGQSFEVFFRAPNSPKQPIPAPSLYKSPK